jgi:hypothetical protein
MEESGTSVTLLSIKFGGKRGQEQERLVDSQKARQPGD